MRHDRRRYPTHFFTSAPQPCPYLPDRVERKLVTELYGPGAQERYEVLSRCGFRRSHQVAYAPACPTCDACLSVRLDVAGFAPSRNLRRIAKANADVSFAAVPPEATREQFALFSAYVRSRHGDGDMARMEAPDYRHLIEETSVDSFIGEYRDPDGTLIAACLVDRMGDGLSAVYSFFDPAHSRRSLGTYIILSLAEIAREEKLPYVYLGFWIRDSRKMAYKTRFQPLEAYRGGVWRRLKPEGENG